MFGTVYDHSACVFAEHASMSECLADNHRALTTASLQGSHDSRYRKLYKQYCRPRGGQAYVISVT